MPRKAAQPSLPTELHSRRQPPSPGQVRAAQRQHADKDLAAAKAALPPEPPTTPQTLPAVVAQPQLPAAMPADTRTPAERYVADNSSSFMPGPLITFNGKTGVFLVAATKEEVSPQRKFMALLSSTWAGYIMFTDGGPPERWGGLMYQPGFVFPTRADLGYLDQSVWLPDLNGAPGDPLQHQIVFPVVDADSQEIFCFGTVSKTGRGAVNRLLDVYNRRLRTGRDELPIVQFVPSSYPGKRGRGPQPIPTFPICSWAKADSAPPTLADDLDDELPGF